jgi:hypothetical protein
MPATYSDTCGRLTPDGLTADTGLKIQASLTPLNVVTNPPPPAQVYDVAADYSTVNNPNEAVFYTSGRTSNEAAFRRISLIQCHRMACW